MLFNRTYDEMLKAQLLGAVMSALNSFAKELDQEGLSSFQLSNKRFSLIKKNKLIFITNTNPKTVKEKKALKELEELSKKFFDTYAGSIIEKWDGDANFFNDFSNQIEESVEEKVQGFLDNI